MESIDEARSLNWECWNTCMAGLLEVLESGRSNSPQESGQFHAGDVTPTGPILLRPPDLPGPTGRCLQTVEPLPPPRMLSAHRGSSDSPRCQTIVHEAGCELIRGKRRHNPVPDRRRARNIRLRDA